MVALSEKSPLLGNRSTLKSEYSFSWGNIAWLAFVTLIVTAIASQFFSNTVPFEQAQSAESTTIVSVHYNHLLNKFEVTRGYLGSEVSATGKFHTNMDDAGWNYLEVEAIPDDSSLTTYLHSMRAMGFVEGFLTWQQISEYYPNYYQSMFDSTSPEPRDPDSRVKQFLLDNFKWMDEKSKEKCKAGSGTCSDHWLTVRGVIAQMEGLLEGFIQGRREGIVRGQLLPEDMPTRPVNDQWLTSLFQPSLLHFMLLNSNGDLYAIMEKFAAEDEAVKNLQEEQDGRKKNGHRDKAKEEDGRKRRTTAELIGVHEEEDVWAQLRQFLTTSSRREDHCSSLIKLLPDSSDIVFGHNTWDDFRNAGPRIFKHYVFPAWPKDLHVSTSSDSEGVPCNCPQDSPRSAAFKPHTYFSSGPGLLTSVDDFYTAYTASPPTSSQCPCGEDAGVGGRLGVMETSLEIYNPALYTLITPSSLFSWVRVRSANLMARDGKEWSKRFSYDQSGTYANQWMVLDFDKFTPPRAAREGSDGLLPAELRDGLLFVVEEMPGMMKFSDQTDKLRTEGYWASYNQVFDDGLSEYSGNTQFCEDSREQFKKQVDEHVIRGSYVRAYGMWPGELNCYHTSSRARLFARLQSSVSSLFDLRNVMDYNSFQKDPESVGDACESISCREDLQREKLKRRAFGALDSKVTSVLRADLYRPLEPGHGLGAASAVKSGTARSSPEIFVRQGPTAQGQRPFCWSDFEHGQNEYYDKLSERLHGRENIAEYIAALQRGDAINVTWGSDDEVWETDDAGWVGDDDEASGEVPDVSEIETTDDPYDDNDHDDNLGRGGDMTGFHSSDGGRGERGLRGREKEEAKESRKQRRRRGKDPSIEYSHKGHPNCFEYDWVVVPPRDSPYEPASYQ